MPEMTPERLEEIRQRCEAATEGPWRLGYGRAAMTDGEGDVTALGPCIPGFSQVQSIVYPDRNHWDGTVLSIAEADADFIVHARTDIPDLVDAVQERDATIVQQAAKIAALREENDRLRAMTMISEVRRGLADLSRLEAP